MPDADSWEDAECGSWSDGGDVGNSAEYAADEAVSAAYVVVWYDAAADVSAVVKCGSYYGSGGYA